MPRGKKSKVNLKGLWAKAKENREDDFGDFIPVEPGMYVCQLVAAQIREIQEQDKLHEKWVVVEGDEDEVGKVINDFEGVDSEDRLTWLQRKLYKLGIDLDEVEPEDYNELLQIYVDMIEAYTCAKIRITEKDGFKNMRIVALQEVDEDNLVDFNEYSFEATKKSSSKSSTKRGRGRPKKEDVEAEETEDEAEAEAEAESSSTAVSVVDGDTEYEGYLVSVEGDEAKINFDGTLEDWPTDSVTIVETGQLLSDQIAEIKKAKSKTSKKAAKKTAKKTSKKPVKKNDDPFAVGVRVLGEYDGEYYPGEVVSAPPGAKTVLVEFDDGEKDNIEKSRLKLENEEDDSSPEKEGAFGFSVGDDVLVTYRKKQVLGTIEELNDEDEIAEVKLGKEHKNKLIDVEYENIEFASE